MSIYNIKAGDFEISVEVDKSKAELEDSEITRLIMAIYQGAITLTNYYDEQKKADAWNDDQREQARLANKVSTHNNKKQKQIDDFEPRVVERPKGVALDSLLDKGGFQDIFMVPGKLFERFMSETRRFGIGFYMGRNALQKGFFPDEEAVILVNEDDSPTTQRIIDHLEVEEDTKERKNNIDGRKDFRLWKQKLREEAMRKRAQR